MALGRRPSTLNIIKGARYFRRRTCAYYDTRHSDSQNQFAAAKTRAFCRVNSSAVKALSVAHNRQAKVLSTRSPQRLLRADSRIALFTAIGNKTNLASQVLCSGLGKVEPLQS